MSFESLLALDISLFIYFLFPIFSLNTWYFFYLQLSLLCFIEYSHQFHFSLLLPYLEPSDHSSPMLAILLTVQIVMVCYIPLSSSPTSFFPGSIILHQFFHLPLSLLFSLSVPGRLIDPPVLPSPVSMTLGPHKGTTSGLLCPCLCASFLSVCCWVCVHATCHVYM